MKDALDRLKNGQQSEACKKYLMDIVAERMTGNATSHHVTPAMECKLHEVSAVEAYEAHTGRICAAAGFFEHPRIEFFGATPDRLVGDDGLLEVKCPTSQTFLRWIMAGEIPSEHRHQLLSELACSRRQWVDLVAFDPRMPASRRLFVRRFVPGEGEVEALETAAEEFLAEVDALFDRVSTTEMVA
jgi:exodeoxyribonuclease (lambda-induced)